jgi:hypothetical protein
VVIQGRWRKCYGQGFQQGHMVNLKGHTTCRPAHHSCHRCSHSSVFDVQHMLRLELRALLPHGARRCVRLMAVLQVASMYLP